MRVVSSGTVKRTLKLSSGLVVHTLGEWVRGLHLVGDISVMSSQENDTYKSGANLQRKLETAQYIQILWHCHHGSPRGY